MAINTRIGTLDTFKRLNVAIDTRIGTLGTCKPLNVAIDTQIGTLGTFKPLNVAIDTKTLRKSEAFGRVAGGSRTHDLQSHNLAL